MRACSSGRYRVTKQVFRRLALVCLSFFAFSLDALAQSNTALNREIISYSEERPANFVFLLDVSGSMLYANERVKAADGSMITLFEALRQALRQIVQDERLVSAKSKIAFITFGTAITEKNAWPTSLSTNKERSELLAKISASDELEADKHGDTYMAGGLEAAFKRAEQFASASGACTTTFIVMLTDGWDEPPAGATYNVAAEAAKFQNKEKELKQKLGVSTWQIRVVGLQRLPDKKAGTTTAVEVAKLLGGDFLDVSKAQKGTVAERIYEALKQTIADLRGQIDLPAPDSPEGIIDFGRISDTPRAMASCKVWNRSCYVEKLTGVKECCARVKASGLTQQQKLIEDMAGQGRFPELPERGKNLVMSSHLPAGAISLKLEEAEYLLAPVEREGPKAGDASGKIGIRALVGSSCPPGAYMGFMSFDSTAKVPAVLPYLLTVPSRLTVDGDAVKVQVRKPGFIFDKDTNTELSFRVAARVNSSYSSDFDLLVEAGPATLVGAGRDETKPLSQLSSKLIQNGEPLNIRINSGAAQGSPVKLEMQIPADTQAGRYEGKISVKCKEHNELVADTGVPYIVEVLASPWDEMAPIAIPVLLILLLVAAIGAYMAIIGSRDRL